MHTIPTLLTTSNDEFVQQMHIFQLLFSRIQLDIGDGKLVPNTTTQIADIRELLESQSVELRSTFDFHLMVEDYEIALEEINALQHLGMNVDTVLINARHTPNIEALQDQYSYSVGLDVFPDYHVSDLTADYHLATIPTIQIMTVNPGFQGSPFLPEMLEKIAELRRAGFTGDVMIDGGVNGTTIPVIRSKEYTPDFICIGSYLTHAGDQLATRVEELKRLA